MTDTDWIERAYQVFNGAKPDHFTDFKHCDECAEHDQTLIGHDRDSIGLDQLGHPSWDPLCFCSAEGKRYYMPALIRLTLNSLYDEPYLDQLLFHLADFGNDNALLVLCNRQQRQFITGFLSYLIDQHSEQLDRINLADELLTVYQIWSGD